MTATTLANLTMLRESLPRVYAPANDEAFADLLRAFDAPRQSKAQ